MTYLYGILVALLAAAAGGGGSSSGSTTVTAGRSDDSDDDVTAAPAAPEPSAPAPAAVVVTPPVETTGGFSSSSSGSSGSVGADVPSLPNSAYDIGWAGLAGEEQLIVELVNRARMDPRSEEIRLAEPLASGMSSSPIEALAVVPTLSDAAEAHSEDMDNQNYFSHTGRDGDRPWDRAQESGHENSYVGENIGWIGSTRTSFDEQARAEAHHHNLWDSDGHQANLMSDNWSEIGVGYDYGSYQGYNGSTFVTELFSDTGKSYLTGVVIEDEDGDEFYDIGEGQGDVRITAFNEDEAFATSTWDSGGYSLALPPGTYTVVFEGGDLDEPYETEVTIGADNVKLDVLDDGGTSVITLSAGPPPMPGQELMETLAMEPLDDALPLDDMPEEEPELAML